MVGGLRRQPILAGHAVLAIGIGLDQAGVDRKSLATDQPFRHAASNRRLEDLAQQIAVAEATVPVLREGGMVGHIPLQAKPAEME